MITRADLTQLIAEDEGPKVSLYMPRHIGSRDTRQDPVRLKNLLVQAENQLAELGVRPEQAARMLEPARDLVSDEAFWRQQSRALVLFVSARNARHLNLDRDVQEQVCAAHDYNLFPLLSQLESDRRFLVLTLSRDQARLYAVKGETISALDVAFPKGVQSVIERTIYDGEHTPEDYRKAELIQYFREVSRAVENYAKREKLPIVLIALPENQGNFRALGNHPDLVYLGVHENPDALSEQDIHARALAAVEPMYAEAQKGIVQRVGSLLGSGRASVEMGPITEAAQNGRLETLLLSDVCEPRLEQDVLAEAIALALRNGANVRVLPDFLMPAQAPAAAIFRY